MMLNKKIEDPEQRTLKSCKTRKCELEKILTIFIPTLDFFSIIPQFFIYYYAYQHQCDWRYMNRGY